VLRNLECQHRRQDRLMPRPSCCWTRDMSAEPAACTCRWFQSSGSPSRARA
ncbi:unnamed protein product, partial [Polarella glacialis]